MWYVLGQVVGGRVELEYFAQGMRMSGGLKSIGLALVAAAAVQFASASAQAQTQECTCTVPSAGSVTNSIGDVQATGATGLVAAPIGTVLGAGSQLVTGAGAAARINFGAGCNLSIAPLTEVIVSAAGDQLCVQVSQNGAPAAPPAAGAPLTLLGLIAGGAGVAYLIGAGDDDASD